MIFDRRVRSSGVFSLNALSSSVLLLGVFALAFLIGCEPPPISELSAENGIQRIRERHVDESWDKVITDVNEFRSRYPYTQYAAEAELMQADAFFQASRYPEAIVAYEDFLRKQPSHSNADLAAFRVGRSYDLQSPDTIDREQESSLKAIEKYQSFLERYPTSALKDQAKDQLALLRRKVAEHYVFVARFYWKKSLYQGSLSRYLRILEEFPMYADLRTEAKERAAECYLRLAQELEKDPKSDLAVYFLGSSPQDLRKKSEEISKR
jgi:outer membrane protein assembly factor BamD